MAKYAGKIVSMRFSLPLLTTGFFYSPNRLHEPVHLLVSLSKSPGSRKNNFFGVKKRWSGKKLFFPTSKIFEATKKIFFALKIFWGPKKLFFRAQNFLESKKIIFLRSKIFGTEKNYFLMLHRIFGDKKYFFEPRPQFLALRNGGFC